MKKLNHLKVEDSILKIKKNKKSVFICYSSAQDEFDTYRTTVYPICIASRYFLFLMNANGLFDTSFGSI